MSQFQPPVSGEQPNSYPPVQPTSAPSSPDAVEPQDAYRAADPGHFSQNPSYANGATAPAGYTTATPAPSRTSQPTTLAHTNTFALVSIILVFVQPLVGIIFGHMALSQIKRNGDSGRGIALTGTIIGYAMLLFWVMIGVLYISMIALFAASFPYMDSYTDFSMMS